MTTDTPDPAPMSLDEQCARAMGWLNMVEKAFLEGATYVTSGSCYDDAPPLYSTDPALLDAKLAWLDEHEVSYVRIIHVPRSLRCDSYWSAYGVTPNQRDAYTHGSATIHEATARLVVAVFERLQEAKKP